MKSCLAYPVSLLILSSLATASPVQAGSIDSVLQSVLEKRMPGARLATAADYSAELKEQYRGKVVQEADFNGDGYVDWAAVVVMPGSATYGVYYIINSKGQPEIMRLVSRGYDAKMQQDFIKTPMFFKAAGDEGIAGRDYNSLTFDGNYDDQSPEAIKKRAAERERKIAPYRDAPAIEVWTGATGGKEDETQEQMSFCSGTWYFENNELKTFRACD